MLRVTAISSFAVTRNAYLRCQGQTSASVLHFARHKTKRGANHVAWASYTHKTRLTKGLRANGWAPSVLNKADDAALAGFARLRIEMLEPRQAPGELIPLFALAGATALQADVSNGPGQPGLVLAVPNAAGGANEEASPAATSVTGLAPLPASAFASLASANTQTTASAVSMSGDLPTATLSGNNFSDNARTGDALLPSAVPAGRVESGVGQSLSAASGLSEPLALSTMAEAPPAAVRLVTPESHAVSTTAQLPLAPAATSAPQGDANTDFTTPLPIAENGNTPELEAAVSGLATQSARIRAMDLAIEATDLDQWAKAGLKIAGRVGQSVDVLDETTVKAATEQLHSLIWNLVSTGRISYDALYDKLFLSKRPDYSDLIAEWNTVNGVNTGTTATMAFAPLSGSGSNVGCSSLGPCADLDIMSGPGVDDAEEANLGVIIPVNWNNNDSVLNMSDIYSERLLSSSDTDLIPLKITALYKSGTGNVPVATFGKLTFSTLLFRAWSTPTKAFRVYPVNDVAPATELKMGQTVYIEAIRLPDITPSSGMPQDAQISLRAFDKIYTSLGNFDIEVASDDVTAKVAALAFAGGTGELGFPVTSAFPRVLFADADYAVPLSFVAYGPGNRARRSRLPSDHPNLIPIAGSGAFIGKLTAELRIANGNDLADVDDFDETSTSYAVTTFDLTTRFLNEVGNVSRSQVNGKSYEYTGFTPPGGLAGLSLNYMARDFTHNAFWAITASVRYSYTSSTSQIRHYSPVDVSTPIDPELASSPAFNLLFNLYDASVAAMDLGSSVFAPTSLTLPVEKIGGTKFLAGRPNGRSAFNSVDGFELRDGIDNSTWDNTVSGGSIAPFFDGIGASAAQYGPPRDGSDNRARWVAFSQITERQTQPVAASSRFYAGAFATIGGKVSVSYGGRSITIPGSGTQTAMDLSKQDGKLNMNLLPSGRMQNYYRVQNNLSPAIPFAISAFGLSVSIGLQALATTEKYQRWPLGALLAGSASLLSWSFDVLAQNVTADTSSFQAKSFTSRAELRIDGRARRTRGLIVEEGDRRMDLGASSLTFYDAPLTGQSQVSVGDAIGRYVYLQSAVSGITLESNLSNITYDAIASSEYRALPSEFDLFTATAWVI